MGMAASQARYIELTARKTNVEYEGQQINQQRTNLANESAGLFNQMLALTVPTAPSTSSYTQTQYTFSDGANDYTITDEKPITGDVDNNYEITYYNVAQVDKGIQKTRNDLGVVNESGTYWITDGAATDPQNEKKLTECTKDDEDYSTKKAQLTQICIDNPTSQITTDLGYDSSTKSITEANIGNAYYYTADGTTYYYCKSDLDTAATKKGVALTLNGYYYATRKEKEDTTSKAYLQTEDSGRLSTVKLDGYSSTFDVTTTTTTNQNAYNDAMNEYNYQTEVYEQDINRINAKTEIIQEEDRTLEMKLKQLDTEQKALQTEMESVKKVIEKNIEETFKTFQS